MPSAPLLKVIDGGLAVVDDVPSLPRPHESDRLFPIFRRPGGGSFAHVVAVSLILHGGLIAASVNWNLFGEERAAGGLDELLVIEGVDVVLLDQAPSMPSPLAEAQMIETADAIEAVSETEMASAVTPAEDASPVAGEAAPVGSNSPMEVAAGAAEEAGEAIAADSEAIAAAEPGWTAARTDEEAPPAEAPPVPVEAEQPDAALATADEMPHEQPEVAATAARDERQDPTEAEEPREAPPEEAPAVEAAAEEAVPEPEAIPVEETLAAVVPEETVKPIEDTTPVAASVVPPEPPAKPKAVETPKPKAEKKKAAALPNPSAPSSEANAAARGPTKGKAGAGGKTPKTQGKASLSSYQSKLVAHLRRYRTYPEAARAKRLRGTAVVSFTINSGGRVVGASLAKGTGHSILDREALAMVRRASPFPPIPPGTGRSQVTVRAPIRFDMR